MPPKYREIPPLPERLEVVLLYLGATVVDAWDWTMDRAVNVYGKIGDWLDDHVRKRKPLWK